MELKAATASLSALAHDGRLGVFRLLVKAGPEGLAAGEIARCMNVLPNTLSANLNLLNQAGLIEPRRQGRSIIYTASYARMTELLAFLLDDCCGGAPEICAPLANALKRTQGCVDGSTEREVA